MSQIGEIAVYKYYDKSDIYDIISETLHSNTIFNNYLVELCASNSCDLRCLHCLHGNENSSRNTLSLEKWILIFNEFYRLGVKHFHITGKEPFMSRTAIKLLNSLYRLKKFNNYDFKFGVSSNCLFSKYNLREVFSEFTPDYIEISIDGTEKEHDFLRGKGSFIKSLTNLQEIQNIIPETQISISTVLHKNNINSVLDLLSTFTKKGVNKFFFQILEPLGYARNLKNSFIETEEILQVIDYLFIALNTIEDIDLKICISRYHVENLVNKSSHMKEVFHNFLETGNSIIYQNNSSIQFSFSILDIPYWKRSIISSDGFILDNARKFEVGNIEDVSLGNIFDQPIEQIASRIKTEVGNELKEFKKTFLRN